jgi:hypothetical protein
MRVRSGKQPGSGTGQAPADAGPRRLAPHVPRASRGPGSVQFGSSPSSAVLSGLDADDLRVLSLLDRGASLAALDTEARRRGLDLARVRSLVTALDGLGLLVSPERPATPEGFRLRGERWSWQSGRAPQRAAGARGRPARSVMVHGGSGLGVPIAAGFAAAGVGTVGIDAGGTVAAGDVVPGGPTIDEVGAPVGRAAAAAVGRVSAVGRVGRRDQPDLAVLVVAHTADALTSAPWLTADIPHLVVAVRESDVVVGPVVLPGRSACLHCLDLTRRDRDLAWPEVLPQLLSDRGREHVRPVPALGQVAAGVAVLMGLSVLDGDADAVAGLAATVSLPLGHPTWRRWAAHPACGCITTPQGDAGHPAPGDGGRGVTI